MNSTLVFTNIALVIVNLVLVVITAWYAISTYRLLRESRRTGADINGWRKRPKHQCARFGSKFKRSLKPA